MSKRVGLERGEGLAPTSAARLPWQRFPGSAPKGTESSTCTRRCESARGKAAANGKRPDPIAAVHKCVMWIFAILRTVQLSLAPISHPLDYVRELADDLDSLGQLRLCLHELSLHPVERFAPEVVDCPRLAPQGRPVASWFERRELLVSVVEVVAHLGDCRLKLLRSRGRRHHLCERKATQNGMQERSTLQREL